MSTRRQFLGSLGLLSTAAFGASRAFASAEAGDRYAALDAAAAAPVLDVAALTEPVIIETIDFLRNGETHLVRVRAKGGAEGVAVSNERDMGYLYPVAQKLIVPYLLGKDARDWETLIEGVYLHGSNYKRQGLLFWLPFASIEFAVLDLLSRLAGKSVATLLGGVPGKWIDVYHAHDDRGLAAEASVEAMAMTRVRYGTRAAKFKVGGRMRRNAEIVPGRSAALIRLARERLGGDFTLYADANGSYDVEQGTRIGRLCEEHGIAIFEEPVPHDQYEETQRVTETLRVPVAGGEQESSHNRFRWMIARGVVDVVQPDLFYFGGLVRSIRVARMAHAAGLECSPHISGTGVGLIYMLHFVSCIPNAGPFQEYKSFVKPLPLNAPAESLHAKNGRLLCLPGPGFGLELDPAFITAAQVL